MSIDQRARAAAETVRDGFDMIDVPDPVGVLRRARRRRRVTASATALVLVAAMVGTIALVRRDDASPRVDVRGVGPRALPFGTTANGSWLMVPTAEALAGTRSVTALASDGSAFLLAGTVHDHGDGADDPVMSWSDDGLRWLPGESPGEPGGSVTSISTHGDTALAIGAAGTTSFVWRSEDHGRHWTEVARGDVFGTPAPHSRPNAFATGALWYDGWWVAYGGAADGYEGIWISRDGASWQTELDSRTSGSVDGVVETSDGSLLAYGLDSGGHFDTLEVGWFTKDPQAWGVPHRIETPGRYYLSSVTTGALLAIGNDIDKHGAPTPVLRSSDGGHTWRNDASFRASFPTAWAITAARVGDRGVIAGTTTDRDEPHAWIASGDGQWTSGPTGFAPPTLPSTSIPYVPPKGSLDFVAAVGNRVVFMGQAPELGRYYIFDPTVPAP